MEAVATGPRIHGAGTSELTWQTWSGLSTIRTLNVDQLIAAERVVIVAPHPDDEVLGCGGLMALLSQQGCNFVLVAVTDGEASHPGSERWPAARLRQARAEETTAALVQLGIADAQVIRASFDDGSLEREYQSLLTFLMHEVQPDDVVIGTWRQDGHPDHDAVGRACAEVARKRAASLLEVPIWAWHWGTPDDGRIPWERAVKIALPTAIAEKKRKAIACFSSQLTEDDSTGNPPILPPHVIARFHRPFELFFVRL